MGRSAGLQTGLLNLNLTSKLRMNDVWERVDQIYDVNESLLSSPRRDLDVIWWQTLKSKLRTLRGNFSFTQKPDDENIFMINKYFNQNYLKVVFVFIVLHCKPSENNEACANTWTQHTDSHTHTHTPPEFVPSYCCWRPSDQPITSSEERTVTMTTESPSADPSVCKIIDFKKKNISSVTNIKSVYLNDDIIFTSYLHSAASLWHPTQEGLWVKCPQVGYVVLVLAVLGLKRLKDKTDKHQIMWPLRSNEVTLMSTFYWCFNI